MNHRSSQRDNDRTLTRRRVLQGAVAAGASMMLGGFARTDEQKTSDISRQARRPYLLFIMSDQQSHDMLGCYGNEQIITPNADRLASEGVRFNHCVSSSPLCTPYRGMLMSGRHSLHNGAFYNDIQLLPGRGSHLGEVLRDAGYRTGYVGKWHLFGGDRNRPIPPGPLRYGFDGTFLSNNCTVDFRPGHAYYWDGKRKTFFDEWEPYGQTRQALKFLDGCKPDEPFALVVSWHPPHDHVDPSGDNYSTEPDLMSLYDPEKIRLRPNCVENPKLRRAYHGYMAMASGIDIALGRILDKLKARGLDDNTIVVFTSDHGDLLGSNNRPWPKGCPEDASLRVPLILRCPRCLPAGRASDLLMGTLDLMPTIVGLLGVPIPRTCHGKDLSGPILHGRDDDADSVPLFMPFTGKGQQGWRGVYTRRYTYSFDEGLDTSQRWNCLYDRKSDPWQTKNQFGSMRHRALQERLHRLSLEWMERFDDAFVPSAKLAQACFGAKGEPGWGVGDTCELIGRPIDLARFIETDSIGLCSQGSGK